MENYVLVARATGDILESFDSKHRLMNKLEECVREDMYLFDEKEDEAREFYSRYKLTDCNIINFKNIYKIPEELREEF